MKADIESKEVDDLYVKLNKEAEASGYHLNPDVEFTKELVWGLIKNIKRYGYPACPCRLASGIEREDLDIICPCDYRDPDLDGYDTCYCALYVSQKIIEHKKSAGPIPERRLPREKRTEKFTGPDPGLARALKFPIWRCRVCGYLCAREGPPEVCPICKARKERFEKFWG